MIKYIRYMDKNSYSKNKLNLAKKEISQIKTYLKKWENRIHRIQDLKTIWTGNDHKLN